MIVTVFDWDDTLMATTHFFHTSNDIKLPVLSQHIKKCLNRALDYGHVYIITNGEILWVKYCIENNLIGCEDILERIHLLSTVDSGISGVTELKQRKISAFDRIGGLFNSRGDIKHHLVCFGDCIYDRDACEYLRKKIGDYTFVKSIKLIRRPKLEALIAQQKVIYKIYPTLLMSSQHLDLVLIPPHFLPSPFFTIQKSPLSNHKECVFSSSGEEEDEVEVENSV